MYSLAAALQKLHALDEGRSQRLALSNPLWVTPDIPRLQPVRTPRLAIDQAMGAEIVAALSRTRRRILQDIPRLQPMRFSATEAEDWVDLKPYLSKSESGIVPIREARMQWQEPHLLDQYGNQPVLHCYRWVLPDNPRLPTNTARTIPIADENVHDDIAITSGQVDLEDGIGNLGIYKGIGFDKQGNLATKLDLNDNFNIRYLPFIFCILIPR